MIVSIFLIMGVALIGAGYWNGCRMYDLGVKHGREREALDARHARERVLEYAQGAAIKGAIKGSRAAYMRSLAEHRKRRPS